MVQQLVTTPDSIEYAFGKLSHPAAQTEKIAMSKQKFPYNSQVIQISQHSGGLPDFDPLVEMESGIANDLFKPFVCFLNYALPFPNRIVYNGDKRRFIFVKGSLVRKVGCTLWTALILWRLCEKVSPDSGSQETPKRPGVLSYIVKASYVFFLAYCAIFFLHLWTRGKTYTCIFNQGIDSSSYLFLKFQCAPRTRLVFLATHASWIFCFTFSFTSHVIGGVVAVMNELTGNKNNSNEIMFGYDKVSDADYSLNEFNPQYSIPVHMLLVLANFLNTFNWMITFLFVGTMALVLRQLFAIFFYRIDSMNQSGYDLDIAREIRTFNKIAALVEKYNSFNGLILVMGAFVSILYISCSVEQAITGVTNISQFSLKIHLFLSYLPIMTAALMVSELHKKASTFADVIKKHYDQWKGVTCSKSAEVLYGIAIVHHDIGMANIAFRGLNFFSITYQFVVTMVSVIVTYSLLAIQWLPQLNSAVMGQ